MGLSTLSKAVQEYIEAGLDEQLLKINGGMRVDEYAKSIEREHKIQKDITRLNKVGEEMRELQ